MLKYLRHLALSKHSIAWVQNGRILIIIVVVIISPTLVTVQNHDSQRMVYRLAPGHRLSQVGSEIRSLCQKVSRLGH